MKKKKKINHKKIVEMKKNYFIIDSAESIVKFRKYVDFVD